jgi:hypothetical protein
MPFLSNYTSLELLLPNDSQGNMTTSRVVLQAWLLLLLIIEARVKCSYQRAGRWGFNSQNSARHVRDNRDDALRA